MSAEIISYVLKNDVIDRTAASVIAANPPGTFLNNLPSSVPPYLYQSLKTLWVGTTTASSAYQTLIVPYLGTGQNSPVGSIVVSDQKLTEQVFNRKSTYSDALGAELGDAYIILYKPLATAVSINPVFNASLRIRYILDLNLRTLQGLSPGMPAGAMQSDLTLNQQYQMLCFYYGNTEPIVAAESMLCFVTDYVRMFSR